MKTPSCAFLIGPLHARAPRGRASIPIVDSALASEVLDGETLIVYDYRHTFASGSMKRMLERQPRLIYVGAFDQCDGSAFSRGLP
jgi:hypothetical protein